VGNGSVASTLDFHSISQGSKHSEKEKDPLAPQSKNLADFNQGENMHPLFLVIHSQLLKSTVL